MPDFEVMPVGTRAAIEETAKLLRFYEKSHRDRAEIDGVGVCHDRLEKATRNKQQAEKLEALLKHE